MCMLLGWRGGAGISSTKANKQILLLIHLRIPSGAPFFLSTPTVQFLLTQPHCIRSLCFYFSMKDFKDLKMK